MQDKCDLARKGILPRSAGFIGRDSAGNRHYYSAVQNQLIVLTPDDSVKHERPLNSISSWVDHIGAKLGWDRLQYDDRSNGFAGLVDDIALAMGGED